MNFKNYLYEHRFTRLKRAYKKYKQMQINRSQYMKVYCNFMTWFIKQYFIKNNEIYKDKLQDKMLIVLEHMDSYDPFLSKPTTYFSMLI